MHVPLPAYGAVSGMNKSMSGCAWAAQADSWQRLPANHLRHVVTVAGDTSWTVQADLLPLYKPITDKIWSREPGIGMGLFTPLPVTYGDEGSCTLRVFHANVQVFSFVTYI